MQPLIIQSLSKRYGDIEVINGLSLEVKPQDGLWCIAGENGSGKSTLLKLIAGLEVPDAGKIAFDGRKIKDPTEQLIAGNKGVVYVQQDPDLLPRHTIAENLEYRLRQHNETYQRQRIAFLTSFFALEPILFKLPGECSGGERQRTALACALSNDTQLLLFDEPFNALDMLMRAELKQIIHKLKEWDECMIVLVTHNPHDILEFAKQLTIMQSGKVLQHGYLDDIYEHPKEAYTAQLLGFENILEAQWIESRLPHIQAIMPCTADGKHYFGMSGMLQPKVDASGDFSVLYSAKTYFGFQYALTDDTGTQVYAHSLEYIPAGEKVTIMPYQG